jgi:hypothetical protein
MPPEPPTAVPHDPIIAVADLSVRFVNDVDDASR